ncbi:MAG: hypothetical protein D8M58_12855 [Calditrichaeota bacterium]|nr:MAG: hypothetical protein DWQ03_13640 [Calditrichota bacterium]MBL1206288.1 hypothetical protein [Calditrichota bacterium]NOG46114.1 hypothetical protein [Calditrichota bacterium]
MKKYLILLLVLPTLILAQKSVDVTGRVSLSTLNFDYDEKSEIKPDTVSSKDYGKTTLIPGLSQSLNLSIFARTQDFDVSLLGDIRNNDWNTLDFSSHNDIDRLSLSLRISNHEVVLGDFYESGSEFFLQSREIRGGKVKLAFDNVWSRKSFFEFKTVYGLAQKAFSQGSRIRNIYKQFETSGQFRRYLGAVSVKAGERGFYKAGFHYLRAEDEEGSIGESLNDPLGNQNFGGDASLFLWDNHIQLFGEGFLSEKDTVGFGSVSDLTYKGGLDFRYDQFKLIAFYQRLGFNFYSAGYPFLLNDREGFRVQSAYNFPNILLLSADVEQYDNNLENENNIPTTTTRIGDLSVTTGIKKFPELTLAFGFRDDISGSVFNDEEEETRTNKISRKWEARISHDFNINRISLTSIYLDLDDDSKIPGGAPLGTEQFIGSLNFYTRPTNNIFFSGGGVFSRLLLTDSKSSNNFFIYQSSRWDIMPRKLVFESTLNFAMNEAQNGGDDDLINNYWQADGRVSLEYFFNNTISLKLIGGTNTRQMDFSTSEALKVLQNPDTEPTFFNGNETYNALIYGAEINWIF